MTRISAPIAVDTDTHQTVLGSGDDEREAMHRRLPWWSYVVFLLGAAFVFWLSGGPPPAF
jgi:hypothetical protein